MLSTYFRLSLAFAALWGEARPMERSRPQAPLHPDSAATGSHVPRG